MSYYGPPGGQPPYQQSYSPNPPYQGGHPPPHQGHPPPMNQGYPPMNQGYPPQQGYGQPPQGYGQPPQGYGPPGGQYGHPPPPHQGQYGHPPPPNQGQYGHPPPPGQYGPPGGQQGGYYGGPPQAPPAPPSPGYIPGQQAQVDMGRAAHELRAAMKGLGTDESTLIKVLSRLGPLEINTVKATYSSQIRRDLFKDVHGETSGNFREALEAIIRGPLEQDCHVLYNSIKGVGTKESAMNDVLLSRSNADLNAIKAHYHHKFGRTLESDVKGDLSMKTERMFDMVLAARRAEESTPMNPQQTEADVREIYGATEGRMGTDQMTVCSILTARSNGQIRAISQQYQQTYRRPLVEVLRSEFSGHMEDALTFIVRRAEDPAKHDADMLEDAMRGMGTNDAALVRRVVAVHWDPARLQQCKAAYKHFYKKELAQRIRDETSGDYRKLVTACIEQR